MDTEPRENSSAIILVVDDDPEMRAILKNFLEREGYHVKEGASGEGAIALVKSGRFDALVLDEELPDMKGLDLLAFLRRHCQDTPVILITAFGGSAVEEEALRLGAARYLEKPFRVADLLEAVRTVAKARRDVPGLDVSA